MTETTNGLNKFRSFLSRFRKNENGITSPLDKLNAMRPEADRSIICHAPFKSIRFEQNGVVRTCCFNRQVILGRYPQQTLTEIWNSDEANKLRAKVAQNDLSFGCQMCARQLNNQEFSTIKTREFDNMPETQNGYPVMLDFSIHNTCNLECVMCNGEFSSSIRKNREKLPPLDLVYDQNFVAQLEEFIPFAQQMVFAGGEPFLIELYLDIWERINVLNPKANVHIVTNGTILTDRTKNILENGRYSITHSIESFEKKTYEIIRQNASYEKMMSNMEHFYSYCKRVGTEYAINICPLQQNWKEIPAFVQFCNEQEIRLYILTVVYPPDSTLMTLPSEKLSEIICYYNTFQFKSKTQKGKKNIASFQDLIKRLEDWKSKAENEENNASESSRMDVTGNSFLRTILFTELMIEIENKLAEHVEKHPTNHGLDMNEINAKLEFIKTSFSHRTLPSYKLDNLRNISSSMLVSLLKTYSNADLSKAIKDHFL